MPPPTWFAQVKHRTKMVIKQDGKLYVYHNQRTAIRDAKSNALIGYDTYWKLLGAVGEFTPDENATAAINEAQQMVGIT